jgi:GNAT superfamily N-acetyltransferase
VTSFAGPVLLTHDHRLSDFDCGDDTLNHWLTTKALRNQAEGGSRTWVVTVDDRVVAFYASSTAVILRAEATKRAARNQPDPVPAVLLGRLAVDTKYQGQGLGAALLRHFLVKALEVAQITGVRVLLVHASDEVAASFYARYGFEPSPIDELTMMLLVKDITTA